MNGPESTEIAADWYLHAFDALYPVVYAHRSLEAARPEVDFAAKVLGIASNDAVLDLCCGNARHMLRLHAYTPRVYGLDYSADLLRHARSFFSDRSRLVRGDMRALPFCNAFDVLVNFFTSFGYFVHREEDQAVLNAMACALKENGRFLMDYLNPQYVRDHLVPRSSRSQAGFEIREERWIDSARQRINKHTLVITPEGQEIATSESVRLYDHQELEAMMESAGLQVLRVYGNYDGDPFEPAHARMILTGRRVHCHG